MEGVRKGREDSGEVYEMGMETGWEDTRIPGERGREEGEDENEARKKGDGV